MAPPAPLPTSQDQPQPLQADYRPYNYNNSEKRTVIPEYSTPAQRPVNYRQPLTVNPQYPMPSPTVTSGSYPSYNQGLLYPPPPSEFSQQTASVSQQAMETNTYQVYRCRFNNLFHLQHVV